VYVHLRSSVGIKPLVRVTNERQARSILVIAGLCGLSSVRSAVVVLVNLVNGEVLRVDVRLQLRFKWRSDPSQGMPINATEEGMLLDLAGATDAAETMFGVTNQAK
jgi:hypothetical protein